MEGGGQARGGFQQDEEVATGDGGSVFSWRKDGGFCGGDVGGGGGWGGVGRIKMQFCVDMLSLR